MRGYASITLVGNATRDAEKHEKHCSITVAVNDGFGENKRTSFFRCVGFGNTYEVLKHIKKGDPVMIVGTPVLSKYNDKQSFSVIIERIVFINSGRSGNGNGQDVSLADMIDGAIDPAKDDFDF